MKLKQSYAGAQTPVAMRNKYNDKLKMVPEMPNRMNQV